jgi:hypothetical protein
MSTGINDTQAKKRRVDCEGCALLSAGSVLDKLLEQNRRMESKMDLLQAEIKCLREKCDVMARSMQANETAASNFRDQTVLRLGDVENRQKYHEILLKNQKWEYSAPCLGVARGSTVKRFLDQIKKATCNMRYGTCDGTISIQHCVIGVVLAYDERFLPHWKEFVNALKEYRYALNYLPKETECCLSLYNVELPMPVLDLLSDALETTHFKSITLLGNNFGGDGITFVLNHMRRNQKLEELHMLSNVIDHEDDIHRFCEIIERHPTFHTINLEGCFGEGISGYYMLCSIMIAGKHKLKNIDLSDNAISTGGSTFVSDFLAMNPILEKLELRGNKLDDNDANAIAEALKCNTNLHYLDMFENNDITESGWSALHRAEFDDTSLNSAADSNHTCYNIYNEYWNAINGNPSSDDMFELRPLRRKKIYAVLSSRNIECLNAQHFDDVPVEFLPDMLRSVQQYSEYHLGDNAPPKDNEDVNSLSVVYEVMRWWDKAFSVYESLSTFNGH